MHYRWGYCLMKFATKLFSASVCSALLASCGSVDGGDDKGSLKTASMPARESGVSDFPVKIGEPYKIGNISYSPQDVISYDEVGYASFYGDELSGQQTANGEVFMPSGISAAHKTLPMPSYAEVTALDTGRTILVRINDRGPFANDRLIDLSRAAADQLGISGQGVASVRVRKVNPPEQERAVLRSGQKAAERIDTPDSLLRVLRAKLDKMPRPSSAPRVAAVTPSANPAASETPSRPAPQAGVDGRFIREGNGQSRQAVSVRPSPKPAANSAQQSSQQDGRFVREGASAPSSRREIQTVPGSYNIQLASFSSRTRAEDLARKVGATVQSNTSGDLFRVRYGPYPTEADAQRGLETARQRGYSQAKIFRE
jgi:rare lipoprotein A